MDRNSAIATDLTRPALNSPVEASPGEGLAGYLFRRQADLPSGAFQRIQGRAGGLRGVEHLHLHVDAIAAATGADVGVLRRMAYMPRKNRLWCRSFAEQDLRRAMIGFCAPKVCPICLAEDGLLRQIWDLKFYTDCARHGVEMINVCPWCEPRTRISWQRTSLGHCDCCGGPYSEAPPAVSDASVLGIQGEIERLASGEESKLLPALNSATAATLRLEAFLEAVLLLGREVVRHWGMTTSVVPTSDLEKTRLLLRGAAIVLDGHWPASYHRFLHAISEKVGAADPPDIRKLLPSFYRQLFIRPRAELKKTGVLTPLQQEFSSWLGRSRPDLSERMSRACLAVRGSASRAVITFTELQGILGVSRRKLTLLIRELGIRMIEARWGKGTTFVARADIARLRAELTKRADLLYGPRVLQLANLAAGNARLRACRRSLAPFIAFSKRFAAGRDFPSRHVCAGIPPSMRIPVNMIARRWGVQPYVVQKAIGGGVFSRQVAEVRCSTHLTAEVYGAFEAALWQATKRLRSGAKPVLTFRKAQAARGLRGVDTAEILRRILSGDLKAVLACPKQRGLARLGLRRGPLSRLADIRISDALAGKCDAKSAMKMFNTTDPSLLTYLVRHGHLRFERLSETGCHVYDPADIEAFHRTFVGPREIGGKKLVPGTGRSPRVISWTLKKLGVTPAMGPGVDECPLVYYWREDI